MYSPFNMIPQGVAVPSRATSRAQEAKAVWRGAYLFGVEPGLGGDG